ncbi:MAG: FtsX-like permease family protein [Ruminococcaceae bacterium]|nr:FtsX-like permease family protein [Oscillospiraceae bacterium]
MFFFSTIRMSFSNLRANAMRTFLTMLGVIIGITSIIALLTIGRGVTDSVIDQLAGLGGNRATVSLENTTVKAGFTDEEMARFAALEGVDGVAPQLSASRAITLLPDLTQSNYDGPYTTQRRVMGVNDFYFSTYTKNAGLLYGRSISADDVTHRTSVCVLGYDFWQRHYGNYAPIGEVLMINNAPCTIVGVMNKLVGIDVSGNNAVIVPYTTASQTLAMGLPGSFDVVIASGANADETIERIEDLCAQLLNSSDKDAYRVVNQEEVLDMVLTITDLVLGMLAGIAVIALVVGGIGIMNMMLVTVSERTAEIGLRKALGARPAVILLQFLIEAMIISLFGGLIGVLLGLGASYIASLLIGYTFSFNPATAALSLLFSLAVGVIFGLLPARRAAKMNPIEALRAS